MIPKYVHRCIVQSGDMAGNDHEEEVEPTDVEYATKCQNCGETMATLAQVTAYIYEHLIEDRAT